ncbi:hypothetical protein CFP56_010928 [Quercus suber]|uniref:Uncharacterized protein n=1 Tax=Quercus suber TaxID=58331 RepID=A0AAW0KZJ6_QUESU
MTIARLDLCGGSCLETNLSTILNYSVFEYRLIDDSMWTTTPFTILPETGGNCGSNVIHQFVWFYRDGECSYNCPGNNMYSLFSSHIPGLG